MKIIKNKTKKAKGVVIDFNGAFIYMPKGMTITGLPIDSKITGGYFIYNKPLNEAVKSLKSKDYENWVKNFKKKATGVKISKK